MSSLRELGEKAFREGRNVTAALRDHLGTDYNTPEAIEVAYDLQAGSYVRFAEGKAGFLQVYAAQLAAMLDPHLEDGDAILDVGTGEMTTLAHMVRALSVPLSKVYATDISEPRLVIGRQYAASQSIAVEAFRSELSSVPLAGGYVDIVTSNHALEPNGGRESEILTELLRIARRKLVLFEPCYELASDEGKARMREHGYVKNLSQHAEELGATVESLTPLEIVHNPLNPTACLVIRPQ